MNYNLFTTHSSVLAGGVIIIVFFPFLLPKKFPSHELAFVYVSLNRFEVLCANDATNDVEIFKKDRILVSQGTKMVSATVINAQI